MYADYIKEHRGDHAVEAAFGFCTYRFLNDNKSAYIVDIYVAPEQRQSNLASILADSVVSMAKEAGATELLGTVVPSAKNSTDSLKILLAYGMKLQSASADLIVFRKDI